MKEILGTGKINHSIWSENDLEELRKKAAEGSIGAKIELAVLEIEDEHDVEKNIAFLEDCAEKENSQALINLYFLYSLTDYEKAFCYIKKATDLGSAWAMEILAINYMLKRISCDEDDLIKEYFLEQEKWHLASHKASETEKNDLLPSGIVLNMNELANLYENSNPKNPLYNTEKATEWSEKAKKFAKEINED
jgi:TPR repeat protein